MMKPPRKIVEEFLSNGSLPLSEPFECPYLPDRQAVSQGFSVDILDADLYVALMDHGFRRSGHVIYRPMCASCKACQQIRIPVDSFRQSKSQRRVWKSNADIRVDCVQNPTPTREKWRMFRDYLDFQHDGTMPGEWEEFSRFLYETPMATQEFQYRIDDEIIGISIVDAGKSMLSSVYMYFNPRFADRSLGTYSALWEIDVCRRREIPYYYLGYYIADAPTMRYKARFRPYEILGEEGWRTYSD